MHVSRTRFALAAVAGLGLAVAVPAAASAHVGVDTDTTEAGAYAVATFALGHGCAGSATTAVTIALPEGAEHATPTAKPGWTIAVTDAAVTYTANEPLADGIRDTFSIALVLPGSAGDQVVFPVTQTCEVGQNDWVEVAADDGTEPDYPAPVITLTAAEDATAAAEATAAEEATAALPSTAVESSDTVARILAGLSLVAAVAAVVLGAIAIRRLPRA